MSSVVKLKRSETIGSIPTTSDLEVGEVAVNVADQKIYMRDSSDNIVLIADTATGAGAAGSAFTNISVAGQTTIQADSATDTLTLVAGGLNSITTNATTDTITIGTASAIPFTLRDGTVSSLEPSTQGGTLSTAVASLYIPFTTEDGTDVTTLAMT
jgi:hypothetical protein